MQNNTLTFRWIVALVIVLISICPLSAQSMNSQTTVTDLLPTGFPPYSEKELLNYETLLHLSDKAYPALCQEMLSANDEHKIGLIISVFIESKGDKTVPLAAIRKLAIKRTGSSKEDVEMRVIVVQALGKIGKPEDAGYLHQQLGDASEAVQINSIRSLGQIGGKESVSLIDAWVIKNKDRLPSAKAEASKAMDFISQRSKLKTSEK